MKRWLKHSVIGVYLAALSWGIVAHTVDFANYSHPAMYYLVWDMFCGWTSYSGRIQIIGEGQSGRYYELAPGPWGEIRPFGSAARRHYDVNGVRGHRFAENTLGHTSHEPIDRVFVIEESWAKKYNLPDHLWEKHFDVEKDTHHYYNVLYVYGPGGDLLQANPNWYKRQNALNISNNPRLAADVRRSQPMFAYRFRNRRRGTYQPGSLMDSATARSEGSRLGGN